MMNWDSRMRNNQSVQMLKAAIPFLDIEAGESIDLAGLLRAVRPFAGIREGRVMDMILQFFQIQDMMQMVSLVQSMQQVAEDMPDEEVSDGEPDDGDIEADVAVNDTVIDSDDANADANAIDNANGIADAAHDAGSGVNASGPFAGLGGFPSPEMLDLIQMFLKPENSDGQEENESIDL